MIALKKEMTDLETDLLYDVVNPLLVESVCANLLYNRNLSNGEKPHMRSKISQVRLVPLNELEYQDNDCIEHFAMKREELLLVRKQLFQESARRKQLRLARENRIKGNLSPLAMSETECYTTDLCSTPLPILHILRAWATFA